METAQRRQTISKLSRIPGYAGGGFIDGLKRAVGMAPAETMREKFARKDAERAMKQPPAPAPTTAPAETGQTAVTSYAAGTLAGDRKKQMEEAIGKKGGGTIKGKGTGTSDEIPIMASNGEFMIKASSVKKIGVEALEALNAIGDQPDEKDSKAEAKAERGMKCGGAVRRMATGGLVTDEEKRKTLVSQIPTGGSGSEPTPAANQTTPGDGQMPYGEQMRNLGSALASIPVNAMKTLVSAPGYGLNSAPATAQPATPAAKAMATVPSAPAATSPQATPAPVAAPSAPPMGASQQMAAAPAQPAFDPLAAKAERDAQTQKDIALGNQMEATRKASEADGYAAQDRGIDTSIAIAAKVDAERARQRAENTLSSTTDNAATRTQKVAASQALASLDSQQAQTAGNESARQRLAMTDQTTRRGQNIQAQGQAEQTGALRASQKLAQDKFAQDSKGAAIDQQGKAQIQALQTALLSEQDPEKRQAIEDNLRAVQGKYGREPAPVRHLVVPGGQVTDETGQVRTLPSQVFNPDTGQFIQQPTMGAAGKALPPGMVKQVGTSGGKPVYEDAKGNRHY